MEFKDNKMTTYMLLEAGDDWITAQWHASDDSCLLTITNFHLTLTTYTTAAASTTSQTINVTEKCFTPSNGFISFNMSNSECADQTKIAPCTGYSIELIPEYSGHIGQTIYNSTGTAPGLSEL